MKTVILNEEELEVLYRPNEGQGGYQGLLTDLQDRTAADGTLPLTDDHLEKIPRYAFEYGNGGWEDRLTRIFKRTLGPRLDGNLGLD